MSSSTTVAAAVVATEESSAIMGEMEPLAEFDIDAWEASFPFAEKTTDPLARELDIAHDLFLHGLRLAKNDSDWYAATEYIAAAFYVMKGL